MSNRKVYPAVIPGDSDVDATTNRRKRGNSNIALALFSPVKKPKRCVINPPPQSTTMISDLHDFIVVEILSRISRIKAIFRCKCVSKRWFNLVSDSYFVSQVLCRHGRRTKPYVTTHVVCPYKDHRLIPLTSTSKLPSILSMNYLPPFRAPKSNSVPIVEATFNDLVLCCATRYYQRDYYICNPVTKHWVALPPTPRAHKSKVPVGFICDPNYAADKASADYRWRVVRIVPNSTGKLKLGWTLEIFSSECGEWTQHTLLDPIRADDFKYFVEWRPGVAWNGKLYWYSYSGFTLEVDPFDMSDGCDYTVTPKRRRCFQLGVCQGRLRMYPYCIYGSITIWELKEISGIMKWCVVFDSVRMLDMASKDPKITEKKLGKLEVLGFLPSNEDIVYLKFPQQIVMCNLREKTLEKSPLDPPIDIGFGFSRYVGWFALDQAASVYTYVLPWWPTPVPIINKPITKGFPPTEKGKEKNQRFPGKGLETI